MKKNMLKLISGFLLIFALSFNANAQFEIGGGLVFSTESGPTIGVDARVQFGVAETFRIAPSLNYLFKSDGVSILEINGDVHYPFAVTESVTIYPIGGLNITRISVDLGFGSGSDSEIGINLGGGVNFNITESIRAFAELKAVVLIDGYSPIIIGAGVLFPIGG